jgi:hypothetical protein
LQKVGTKLRLTEARFESQRVAPGMPVILAGAQVPDNGFLRNAQIMAR